jgi:GNAT superfamily N-acetyltransferase
MGYEEQILRLRNMNRETAQTREYLDWRYQQLPDNPPPRVAWLVSGAGEAVGMAAAIFRIFWIKDALESVAVIGDISLDACLRGQGLGQKLLKGLSEDLINRPLSCRAFVIPTEAARRSLNSLGWRSAGKLIPYVCLLNPSIRLARVLRSKSFGGMLGVLARSILRMSAKSQVKNGFWIDITDGFDSAFDELWARLPKAGLIMSDRRFANLTWRYHNHPNHSFRVARLICKGELKGYVIFEAKLADREYIIQDIVVENEADLVCMLALFISYCIDHGDVDSIRLLLSDCHPYSHKLWRLGFFARDVQAIFQALDSPLLDMSTTVLWCLTGGDKDI